MNLDNGCGIEGLRGIPKNNQNLIRPFLSYKKSEIKKYIKRKKLNFVFGQQIIQLFQMYVLQNLLQCTNHVNEYSLIQL